MVLSLTKKLNGKQNSHKQQYAASIATPRCYTCLPVPLHSERCKLSLSCPGGHDIFITIIPTEPAIEIISLAFASFFADFSCLYPKY